MEALDLQLQQTKDRCARQRLRVGRRDRHHRTRRNALSAMGASPCHGCAHSESPFVPPVMPTLANYFLHPLYAGVVRLFAPFHASSTPFEGVARGVVSLGVPRGVKKKLFWLAISPASRCLWPGFGWLGEKQHLQPHEKEWRKNIWGKRIYDL